MDSGLRRNDNIGVDGQTEVCRARKNGRTARLRLGFCPTRVALQGVLTIHKFRGKYATEKGTNTKR
ncbi:hypothetical protein TRIP_C60097 [Candidatus Zixiibacteriota bacterium]|nr:hypothetical protein TRIP_C60097 [candidate division Zixibacteria bacterium]